MPVKRPKKQYKLSGKKIVSLDGFYDEIARAMKFPKHFGRNLDALWDVLTTDSEGPLEIIWGDSALSKIFMDKDFDRVAKLLEDVAKERDDIQVTFR
jgi:ribonuclease inhibitor